MPEDATRRLAALFGSRLTVIGSLAVVLALLMLGAALVGAYPISPARWRRPSGGPRAGHRRKGRSRPSCSRCGCRACWRRRWPARRWPRPVPPIRPCSATRWCRPIFWASRPGRGWAPCSASSCRCRWPASSSWRSPPGSPRWASSMPSPRWCTAASRSWCWCWPGWWWARSPARRSRSSRFWPTPTTSCRPSRSGCWAASPPCAGPRCGRPCRWCCWAWCRSSCCAGASTCSRSATRRPRRWAWRPAACGWP